VSRPLIVVTNDDGIRSPGLAAAAQAVAPLGEVLIVAPREQQSGSGRSMPVSSDGRLFKVQVARDGQRWEAYAAHASPAQAVQHALMELADRKPALVVSGINYGENLTTSITISGTVGAALESASHGVPSIAISLQTAKEQHLSYDETVDFSGAQHFLRMFAEKLIAQQMPFDVDVLKIDVPQGASAETPWRVTRLDRNWYYVPLAPSRETLDGEGRIGYDVIPANPSGPDTDVAAIVEGVVSVTPLSVDMTSRVDLDALGKLLRDTQDGR